MLYKKWHRWSVSKYNSKRTYSWKPWQQWNTIMDDHSYFLWSCYGYIDYSGDCCHQKKNNGHKCWMGRSRHGTLRRFENFNSTLVSLLLGNVNEWKKNSTFLDLIEYKLFEWTGEWYRLRWASSFLLLFFILWSLYIKFKITFVSWKG